MEAQEYVAGLVEKAKIAQQKYESFTQEQVDAIVKAIGKVVFDNAEELARMAVDETKMGVYEDKIKKNQGKARIIWNSLKGQPSVGVIGRDETSGLTLVARPVGVVGAIAPCTNPVVTPMSNAMFAIKGRNSIIVAPHPRAKKCNKIVLDEIIKRITALGAPEHAIQYIEEPTNELSAELMKSVDAVVATGGMGMVRAAYSSGRPAFGVGAGNVQCIIDRGVDAETAAVKIVAGRIFDNGIICSAEQSAVIHKDDCAAVIGEFKKCGAYYVKSENEIRQLKEALFPGGTMNKELVGQPIIKTAEAAGLPVPENTKLIVVKASSGDLLLGKEKMCPVLAAYTYETWEEAVEIAKANLEIEGNGHSCAIHSNNREHIEYAGAALPVCRVIVNQICATQNGGSFYNSLTPTTTLGCGSWGNNSISENLSYTHLFNKARIAYTKPEAKMPSDDEIWS
jgi:succinate-semialdehyde dehydrogenase